MADCRHLRQDAERLRERMRIKLHEADNATQKARSLNNEGKYNDANIEDDRADRFYQEAICIERDAIDCDRRAVELEIKASDLDRQENELRMNMQVQIDRLEQQKRILRGDY